LNDNQIETSLERMSHLRIKPTPHKNWHLRNVWNLVTMEDCLLKFCLFMLQPCIAAYCIGLHTDA